MSIKVLQLTKGYPPSIGGIESLCYDLSKVLENAGYDQQILAFNDSKKTVKDNYEGITVTRVGVWRKIYSQPISFAYQKELFRLMETYKPDIIHFHYPNPFAAHFLLKAIKKYNFKGKLVLHWHSDIIRQKKLSALFDSQNKNLISRADVIVVTSPRYLKDTSYLPFYSEKKFFVLPSKIGNERTKITSSQKEKAIRIKERYHGKIICFFFGRHVEYKGLSYLIHADEFLNQQQIQIIIAGEGPLTHSLKRQASGYHNITFVGRLSESDINSYLLASDIFTFPSIERSEAFGISLAEAMSFGKPAVTFEIKGSGVNWVSINGETGLQVKNRDVREYAKSISLLADNPLLRQKLGEEAKKRSALLFSANAFTNNVLTLYSELSKK